MRAAGVVESERVGREVRYSLTDPEVVSACALMRGVLERRISRLSGLSAGFDRPAVPIPFGIPTR
jgi:DNA-binding transcriptional ArsR family regulator